MKIYDELFVAAHVAVRCVRVDEALLPEGVSPGLHVKTRIQKPALNAIHRFIEVSKRHVATFYDAVDAGRVEARRLKREASRVKAAAAASSNPS